MKAFRKFRLTHRSLRSYRFFVTDPVTEDGVSRYTYGSRINRWISVDES